MVMKYTHTSQRLLVAVSLAVSAIVGGQLSARAEAVNPALDRATTQSAETVAPLTASKLAPTLDGTDASLSQPLPDAAFERSSVTPQTTTIALTSALEAAPLSKSSPTWAEDAQVTIGDRAVIAAPIAAVPVPGTVPTSVAALTSEVATPTTTKPEILSSSEPATVAQMEPITPGRATRSGPSYVGLGVNIGAIGRTPLGDFSGAILSKIGLTRNFSVRPAVLINGDATFLLPITYDFPFESAGRVSFAPYVGVGASFSTGDRKNADLIVSGGIDIPLSPQFTLTAAANAGLINGVELGVLVGVGYTFSGF